MKTIHCRALTVLALLLVGLVAACDVGEQGRTPLSPDAITPAREDSETDGEEDGTLATEESSSGATRAAAWIGSGGGSLTLDGHTIVVPEGAVGGPLCFTMELGTGDYVDVDLHAWEMEDSDGCKVEGDGEEEESWDGTLWTGTFAEPVVLSLTYSRVTNADDPSDLVVAWQKSATDVDLLPSSVDSEQEVVSAELDHFSMYALIMP